MHSVTGKLNKAARQHQNKNGVTFFVSVGEQFYNYKTHQNEWTNYEAAFFPKESQIEYYSNVLVEGAVIAVSGTALQIQTDPNGQYPPNLSIQGAKITFVSSGQPRPKSRTAQPQAPRMNQEQAAQAQPAEFADFDEGPPF